MSLSKNCILNTRSACCCVDCIGEFSATLAVSNTEYSQKRLLAEMRSAPSTSTSSNTTTTTSIFASSRAVPVSQRVQGGTFTHSKDDEGYQFEFSSSTTKNDISTSTPVQQSKAVASSSSSLTSEPVSISSLPFNPFDPSRKFGFLVEWRVTPNSPMDQAIAKAQQHLIDNHQPKIQVLKSCAAGNFHITLNEFICTKNTQLEAVIAFTHQFATETMPSIVSQWMKDSSSPNIQEASRLDLDGLKDFRRETFFVSLSGKGTGLLKMIYGKYHNGLYEHLNKLGVGGVLTSRFPRRDLTPHLTIGRANTSGVPRGIDINWYDNLMNDKTLQNTLSKSTVPGGDTGEIVFCSKRAPSEDLPPVIMKMYP